MNPEIETNSKYLRTHEWARLEGDVIVCGVSRYADVLQADIVYVELPTIGSRFRAKESYGVIESINSVSDVYIPITGAIIDINSELEMSPEIINQDPYGAGWMIKVKPDDLSDLNRLMNANEYKEWLHTVEKSQKSWEDEYVPSPQDMIGSIVGGHRVESIEAMGAESVVFNLLNLDTGEIDRVWGVSRSSFDQETVLLQRLNVALQNHETDQDRVIRICDQILQLNPNNAEAAFYKAISMSVKGELDQALEWFDIAIANQSRNFMIWLQKSIVLSLLNKHDEAAEHFIIASSLDMSKLKQYLNKIDRKRFSVYLSLMHVLKSEPEHEQIKQAIEEYFSTPDDVL